MNVESIAERAASEVARVLLHSGTNVQAADAARYAVLEGFSDSAPDEPRIVVEVWVCPTVGCGDYYAARSAGDLASKSTAKRVDGVEVDVLSRAACPSCRRRGENVQRVRRHVEVVL